MNFRTSFVALALATLAWTALPASTSLMPLDEVKPGMAGVGRTVFAGTDLDEFKVHILGVLKNVQGPRRSLILARLEGGPLPDTGVIAGMSGSPVFIDGRLIGAVSYSIGAFSKEPIAGITPIAEMTGSVNLPAGRVVPRNARLEFPLTRERVAAALRAAYAQVQPWAQQPADVQPFGLPGAYGAQLGTMLRPIATPMVMSGFAGEASDLLAGALAESGFAPMPAQQPAAPATGKAGRLEAGDAIGVTLISGDLEMGGTGTVTYVDGDRVYAFGHPFFNLGPTQFPMTKAYVHSLLPSLMSSFKIATLGEVVGTVQQDRATAIAGTLGPGPAMVPMTLRLESDRAEPRTFRFQIVNDQLFTSLLSYVSIFNTLAAYERQFGAATFAVKGTLKVKGHPDVAFEDVFAGDSPTIGAAASVTGPIALLLTNDIAPVDLEGVDVTIVSTEHPRTATIERVWLDEIRPRAGRTVPLKVLTRSYRGDEQIRTLPIEIPSSAAGTLSILVSDGVHLAQFEQRDQRQRLQPQSIALMIKALNEARKNNRVYVRLISGSPGAIVDGETLPALPPSVLAVFEGDRNGGSFVPLRNAAIGEWEIETDHAVSGSRVLTITVEPGGPGASF
jgi:hypothetical protein